MIQDHSSRPVQVTDPAAAALAQTTAGGRASHWTSEVGPPDGSPPVAGAIRRL